MIRTDLKKNLSILMTLLMIISIVMPFQNMAFAEEVTQNGIKVVDSTTNVSEQTTEETIITEQPTDEPITDEKTSGETTEEITSTEQATEDTSLQEQTTTENTAQIIDETSQDTTQTNLTEETNIIEEPTTEKSVIEEVYEEPSRVEEKPVIEEELELLNQIQQFDLMSETVEGGGTLSTLSPQIYEGVTNISFPNGGSYGVGVWRFVPESDNIYTIETTPENIPIKIFEQFDNLIYEGNSAYSSPLLKDYNYCIALFDTGATQIKINSPVIEKAPTDITLSTNVVSDIDTSGIIGNLTTIDPNESDMHSYILVSGDGAIHNGLFTIIGNDLAAIEHLSAGNYSIRIRTTDNMGLSFEKVFIINVLETTEISFNPTKYSVTEDGNSVTLTIERTGDTSSPVTVDYTLSNGTAIAGNDFNAVSGTLTFASGETTKTITVTIVDDTEIESDETFTVSLSNVSNGNITVSGATVTITDNDVNQAPTDITLSNNTIFKNERRDTEVGMLTTTDVNTEDTFTYDLVTGEGDSDNNKFYINNNILKTADVLTNGTYSVRIQTTDIAGNSYQKIFNINVSERVLIGGTEKNRSVPSIIVNNDTNISLNKVGYSYEGWFQFHTGDNEPGSYILITPNDDLWIEVQTYNVYTPKGVGYGALSTFELGTNWDLYVYIRGNSPSTTLTILPPGTKVAPTNIELSNNIASIYQLTNENIGKLYTDDLNRDDTHTYSLVAGDGDIDNDKFTIEERYLKIKSPLSIGDYTIRIQTTDTAGISYQKSFTITVYGALIGSDTRDLAPEITQTISEIIVLETSGVFKFIPSNTGDYTITTASGAYRQILIGIGTEVISSGIDSVTASLNANETYYIIIRAWSFDKTVNELTIISPNEAPVDISLSNIQMVGDVVADTVIGILDTVDTNEDTSHVYSLVEGINDFKIEGKNLKSKVDLTTGTYNIIIRSTDKEGLYVLKSFIINVLETPKISFNPIEYSVTEDGNIVTLTIERTGDTTLPVTVDYVTSNGTAIAGNDFNAVSGTLTFASGETTKTITVTILNDTEIESDETFTVGLSNATGDAIITSNTATVTITDNDTIAVTGIALDKSTLTLTEGSGTATLVATVEPSNATNQNVTWISSNESVATIDSNGKVSAVAKGTATITVITEEGSFIDTSTVTVTSSSSTGGSSSGTSNKTEDTSVEDAIDESENNEEVSVTIDKKELELDKEDIEKIVKTGKPLEIKSKEDVIISVPTEILKNKGTENLRVEVDTANKKETEETINTIKVNQDVDIIIPIYKINISTKNEKSESSTLKEVVKISVPAKVQKEITETVVEKIIVAVEIDKETKKMKILKSKFNAETETVEIETRNPNKEIAIVELPKKTFKDVKEHWAKDEIEFMATVGHVKGMNVEEYLPDRNVTRAEFATIMIRVMGKEQEPVSKPIPFEDVSQDAWCYSTISKAYELGLIKGVELDRFAPNELVTREQMASIITRALEYENALSEVKPEEELNQFIDKNNIGDWAKSSVAQLSKQKILTGKLVEDLKVHPQKQGTRAETAVMLNNFYGRIQ